MHPIHDVDVLVLLAMALSSKRRPAELVEIMAAADLIQGSIPPEMKLRDAFYRLSTQGLISEVGGSFTLTPEAQNVMAGQPKRADTAERIVALKGMLSAYNPMGEHAPIQLAAEQISAAIRMYRSSGAGAGQNLLMPKPKAKEGDNKRKGQWRKFGASRTRRD